MSASIAALVCSISSMIMSFFFLGILDGASSPRSFRFQL